MKIHFITAIILTSILPVACSTADPPRVAGAERSFLESIPIVYRQDIQQGNVITQDMVNQLHPGLSKRQVRFIMGTPMLIDVFHESRWDYIYNMTEGWGDTAKQQVHLYFNGDQLTRIEGDLKPDPSATVQTKPDLVVSVPDYKDPNRGVIKQAVEQVSSIWEEIPANNTSVPTATQAPNK